MVRALNQPCSPKGDHTNSWPEFKYSVTLLLLVSARGLKLGSLWLAR